MENFVQPGLASVVVGGQFGSEAKGLVAACLAINSYHKPDICTTNAGAQAGHTTVLANGTKFVCYHLPTIGVLTPSATIYINAGSIIDPDLLDREVEQVALATGEDVNRLWSRICIHPNACIITSEAKQMEAQGATRHLGSTMKGVGAALANKIMRRHGSTASTYNSQGRWRNVQSIELNSLMCDGAAVTVEIPQGTDLSINASSFYPKCTSRDCWVGQGLTDAGIHPRRLGKIAMVVRTFPIRVGHVFDPHTGEKTGDSGPFYGDSVELDWEKDFPGIEPERTTVTQRVRRIATWSREQWLHAYTLNDPDYTFLTFTNYCTKEELSAIRSDLNGGDCFTDIYESWGPRVDQVGPKTPTEFLRS